MSPGNVWRFYDLYYHYRHIVCLGRLRSVYRALYYMRKRKEPWE